MSSLKGKTYVEIYGDKMREIKIVELLQCVLIRIDEQLFMQNVGVV